MFTAPEDFRPGGGETTAELSTRSVAAWHALPEQGLVVVVTHGGPIAAVRTMLANASLTDIVNYRIRVGSIVAFGVPEGMAIDCRAP
jgi:broad specificity phosphatase PhoE